jgi:hypothetical protein
MDCEQDRPRLGFPRDGFISGAVTLLATVLLGYAAISPVAAWTQGTPGLWAAAVAALICLAAGMMALGLIERLSASNPLASALGGMTLRMVVPLSAVAAVYWWDGPLTETGMVFYVLAFYMITLAVETYLAVRKV